VLTEIALADAAFVPAVEDAITDALEAEWAVMLGAAPQRHYGPGPHPDGSEQKVHAGPEEPKADSLTAWRPPLSPKAAIAPFLETPGGRKLEWTPTSWGDYYGPDEGEAGEVKDEVQKALGDRFLPLLSSIAAQYNVSEDQAMRALWPLAKMFDDLKTPGVLSPPDVGVTPVTEPVFDLGSLEGRIDAAMWRFVGEWAATSGDSSTFALGLQMAAAKEFGLTTAEAELRANHKDQMMLAAWDSRGPIEQDVLRALVRNQYDYTQEVLKARGIEYLDLARGVTSMPDRHLAGVTTLTLLNPLSSWTTSRFTAERFAGAADVADQWETRAGDYLLQARVPASRIFSTAVTGPGCLNEFEVVVLGAAAEGDTVWVDSRVQWDIE
jgi:hypothetical protein